MSSDIFGFKESPVLNPAMPLCYDKVYAFTFEEFCGISSISDRNCGKTGTAGRMKIAALEKETQEFCFWKNLYS
jgi:hypothetical protein